MQKTQFKKGCKALNPIKKGQHLSPATQFKKGGIPWIKGKVGMFAAWNKGKPFEAVRGENHWNWKNGKSSLAKQIRYSLPSKEWRSVIVKRDRATCVLCESTKDICVDHIKPLSEIMLDHNITNLEEAFNCTELWDIKNGRVLCTPCHKATDTYLRKQHILLSNKRNAMYGSKKGKAGGKSSSRGGKGGKRGC